MWMLWMHKDPQPHFDSHNMMYGKEGDTQIQPKGPRPVLQMDTQHRAAIHDSTDSISHMWEVFQDDDQTVLQTQSALSSDGG